MNLISPRKTDRFLASFAAIPAHDGYRPKGEQSCTLKAWGFNAAIAKPLDQWGVENGLAAHMGSGEASWNTAFLKVAVAQHVAMFGAEGRSDIPEQLLKAAAIPWPTAPDGQRLDVADIVPLDTPGWLRQRVALFEEYRSPEMTFRLAWNDESGWWDAHPSQSGIKETVADTLHRYGASRLQPLGCDVLRDWDCEITQEDHLVYTVSFFNALGGRLTLHGVTMTANRTGVVGIAGLTVKA